MQAENSSKGKKSKKGRQYSTPPASPKAGRLGIAKELINLLFEDLLLNHDAPVYVPRLIQGMRKEVRPLLTFPAPWICSRGVSAMLMFEWVDGFATQHSFAAQGGNCLRGAGSSETLREGVMRKGGSSRHSFPGFLHERAPL